MGPGGVGHGAWFSGSDWDSRIRCWTPLSPSMEWRVVSKGTAKSSGKKWWSRRRAKLTMMLCYRRDDWSSHKIISPISALGESDGNQKTLLPAVTSTVKVWRNNCVNTLHPVCQHTYVIANFGCVIRSWLIRYCLLIFEPVFNVAPNKAVFYSNRDEDGS